VRLASGRPQRRRKVKFTDEERAYMAAHAPGKGLTQVNP
jgi:hypothetical protein